MNHSKMSQKHTPGPWRLRELIDSSHAIYGEGEYDLIFPKFGDIDANSALIVAAPDLLEAAIDFVNKVETGRARSRDSYAKFKTAIAKAEPPK